MKIYTKRGDKGLTDLFGGMRVSKNHFRVKAYGLIDAANCGLGLVYSISHSVPIIKEHIHKIMGLLFCAGSEIACAPNEKAHEILFKHLKSPINKEHVLEMEEAIDELELLLKPLKNFILPTGSELASRLHFARNLVRQAEIGLCDLKEQDEPVRDEIIMFFNRLSDFLFVLARFSNQKLNISDEEWNA